MKKIHATLVIQPERMEEIQEILKRSGCPGSVLKKPEGRRRHKGLIWQWRVELLPKMRLEITAPDGEAERLAENLCRAAATGQAADMEICFYEVEGSPRTGERNNKAGSPTKEVLLAATGGAIGARRTAC